MRHYAAVIHKQNDQLSIIHEKLAEIVLYCCSINDTFSKLTCKLQQCLFVREDGCSQ